MHFLLNALSTILFPKRCIGCGTTGTALCERCIATIPLAPDTNLPRSFAAFDYGNRLVERAIQDFKYHSRGEAVRALTLYAIPSIAAFIGEVLQSEHSETLVLVPIPQHAKKRRRKGFNHSERIARIISSGLDNPPTISVLEKYRFTLPQAQIRNKSLRFENVKESLRATKLLDPHMLYIVVDDVTTTGATFLEAERALRAAGARKILSIALAHGLPKRK